MPTSLDEELASSESRAPLENSCANADIEMNSIANADIEMNSIGSSDCAHHVPFLSPADNDNDDLDHSDSKHESFDSESDHCVQFLKKSICVESKDLEFPTRCFACAMSVMQFFDFFGEALIAADIPTVSITEVARLCIVLSESHVSDEGMTILDSIGQSLCTVLRIRIEEHQHWSETIALHYSSFVSDETDRHSNAHEINAFIKTAQIENNSSDFKSWFRSTPNFRIELISIVLAAAAECELLRSVYDTWTEKSHVLQAKANNLQRLLREIDEQNEEFAMQVTEPWRESGGFRLFQIIGAMQVTEDGTISCDVREWSPGQDVLQGGHSVIGEQRFSIQGKTARKLHVDQSCWFPVTVLKRSVMRGTKERPYFQILDETSCVAHAYSRLSGAIAGGMGRTESRARLEKELECLRQAMSNTSHSKARTEPIGTDCHGRRYWTLKNDPNFIFTQDDICGEERWGCFEGIDDIRRLLAGLDSSWPCERVLIKMINKLFFSALQDQMRAERNKLLEDKVRTKEETARRRQQMKDEAARERIQAKADKARKKQEQEAIKKERCKPKQLLALCAEQKSKVNPSSPFLRCVTCNKDSGFYSPFPGVTLWVCSSECGQRMPSSPVPRKVLKGTPATGLGLLSNTANHLAAPVSAAPDQDCAQSAPRSNSAYSKESYGFVSSAQTDSIRGSSHSSAADCIKHGLNSPTLTPIEGQMRFREQECVVNVSPSITDTFSSSGTPIAESICLEHCIYKRSSIVDQFMLQCLVCSRRFHGKCVRVGKRDVANNDAVWVCSTECEEDLPYNSKVGKHVVVGAKPHTMENVSATADVRKAKFSKDSKPNGPKRKSDVRICIDGCKYKNVLRRTHFTLECAGCERGFHGKCVHVTKRDVLQHDLTWVCSKACALKLASAERKILIGSTQAAEGTQCTIVDDSDPPGKIKDMCQSELFCTEQCKYHRSADVKQFMVECGCCNRWFHGKCMRISERDVARETVLWVCSADCEEDLPVGKRTGKDIIVASSSVKVANSHQSTAMVLSHDNTSKNVQADLDHDRNSKPENRPDLSEEADGNRRARDVIRPHETLGDVDEFEKVDVSNSCSMPSADLQIEHHSDQQSLTSCIEQCQYKNRRGKDAFMVECSGCQRWFHGHCLRVEEEDVSSEDVVWVCSATCCETLSVAAIDRKRLLVGSTVAEKFYCSRRKESDKSGDRHSNVLLRKESEHLYNKGSTIRKRKVCAKLLDAQTKHSISVSEGCFEASIAKNLEHKFDQVRLENENISKVHAATVTIQNKGLAKFMGLKVGSISTRTAVNSFVLEYLRKRELLDEADTAYCLLDKKLTSVLGWTGRYKLKKVAKRIRSILDDNTLPQTPEQPKMDHRLRMDGYENSAIETKRHKSCLFANVNSSAIVAEAGSGHIMEDEDDDVPLFALTQKSIVLACDGELEIQSAKCQIPSVFDENKPILTTAVESQEAKKRLDDVTYIADGAPDQKSNKNGKSQSQFSTQISGTPAEKLQVEDCCEDSRKHDHNIEITSDGMIAEQSNNTSQNLPNINNQNVTASSCNEILCQEHSNGQESCSLQISGESCEMRFQDQSNSPTRLDLSGTALDSVIREEVYSGRTPTSKHSTEIIEISDMFSLQEQATCCEGSDSMGESGDSREITSSLLSKRTQRPEEVHIIAGTEEDAADHMNGGLGDSAQFSTIQSDTCGALSDVSMSVAVADTVECKSNQRALDCTLDDDEDDAALLDMLESRLEAAAPEPAPAPAPATATAADTASATATAAAAAAGRLKFDAVSAGEEETDEMSLEELEMLEASIAAGLC